MLHRLLANAIFLLGLSLSAWACEDEMVDAPDDYFVAYISLAIPAFVIAAFAAALVGPGLRRRTFLLVWLVAPLGPVLVALLGGESLLSPLTLLAYVVVILVACVGLRLKRAREAAASGEESVLSKLPA